MLRLTAYELRADVSRNTRGVPLVNVIPLTDVERVSAVIGTASLDHDDMYLVMGTRRGSVKRMALSAISSIRPSGLIVMNLKKDDEVVAVRLATEAEDVIIVTAQGMSIRFAVTEVTARQRAAGGLKGITLRRSDVVVAMDIVNDDTRLLVISEQGFGKLTRMSEYRKQGRGGVGIKTFNIRTKTGKVAAAAAVDASKEVYVVSEQAQVLRTSLSEISSMGRATQGVTIFKPQPGDAVASIAVVSDLDKDMDKGKQIPLRGVSKNGNTGNGKSEK